MLVIGNEELDSLPSAGKAAKCPACGKEHEIKYGKVILEDGTKKPSDMLGFINCGKKTYLVSVKDKLID